jgi:hypothetical protein
LPLYHCLSSWAIKHTRFPSLDSLPTSTYIAFGFMQPRPCITPQLSRKAGNSIDGSRDGTDFVRCRICGKRLCVISGRHLSTHGTDRETYMEEYGLSPDQLCSKAFRVNHSSRNDYCPHKKREWITAMKKTHKQHGQVFAGYLQDNLPHLYSQGVWLFGDWDKALRAAGFAQSRCACGAFGIRRKLSDKYKR